MAEADMDTDDEIQKEENKIRFNLDVNEDFIRNRLNSTDLKDLILHYPFPSEKAKELSSFEEKKTPAELFHEIVRTIHSMGSNHERSTKYKDLADAFWEMHNEKVHKILTGREFPDDTHDKLLHKCGPAFCKMLDVESILPNLVAKELINDTNRQIICQTLQTKGDWNAAFELWKCLPNIKSNWLELFMEILQDKQPDLEKILNKEHEKVRNIGTGKYASTDDNPQHGPVPSTSMEERVDGDMMETTMSDKMYEEQENRLAAPPPIPAVGFENNINDSNKNGLGCSRSMEFVSQEVKNHSFSINPETSDEEPTVKNSVNKEEIYSKSTNTCDEANSSCFKLRDYQYDLAENALAGKNTVIVAGTGSGKTWVAFHIVKEHLARKDQGKRKVVFMARTSTLIKQQAERLQKNLPEYKDKTKLVTGENEESNFLGMFLEFNDILCFTPQILVNNLDNGSIKSLSQFSLMIFDECHHTRGDEPYNMLMRRYHIEKTLKKELALPQVVGLTASIGVGKSRCDEDACDYILRLFANLDVRHLSTVSEKNLETYKQHTSDSIGERIRMINAAVDHCKEIILEAMEDLEENLKDFTAMELSLIDLVNGKCPPHKDSQEYSAWTAEVDKTAMQCIDDEELLRTVRSFVIYLKVYNAALEVNKLLGPPDVLSFLARKQKRETENKSKLSEEERKMFESLKDVLKSLRKNYGKENPNVRMLSNNLKQKIEEDIYGSRAMVFVQARATCVALTHFLQKDFKPLGIGVHHLYGKENRGETEGMTESEQKEAVEKFRNGDYKILVATSIGAEGIDVPDCNIVLNYNCTVNEISTLQMKGRGRKKKSHNVTIGDDKLLEREEINAFKLNMMENAKKLFLDMDPKVRERKISLYQKEEIAKYKMRKELEKAKLQKKTDLDFLIKCRRCGEEACSTSDIRQIKNQYIVIEKSFEDKMIKEATKKQRMYDGFHLKFDMKCSNCGFFWGNVTENRGYPCWTLKLDSFKLMNKETGDTKPYKKWVDVPTEIPEIQPEDLPRLIGEPEQS